MANSLISMIKGDSTLIDNTEVLDGQILFDETKQKIFLDDENERKEYGGSADDAVKKDDVAYVESAMMATRGYSTGNYIIVQDTLYKTTTQINSGTALVVGTNVSTTTVGSELAQLNNDLTDKVGFKGSSIIDRWDNLYSGGTSTVNYTCSSNGWLYVNAIILNNINMSVTVNGNSIVTFRHSTGLSTPIEKDVWYPVKKGDRIIINAPQSGYSGFAILYNMLD